MNKLFLLIISFTLIQGNIAFSADCYDSNSKLSDDSCYVPMAADLGIAGASVIGAARLQARANAIRTRDATSQAEIKAKWDALIEHVPVFREDTALGKAYFAAVRERDAVEQKLSETRRSLSAARNVLAGSEEVASYAHEQRIVTQKLRISQLNQQLSEAEDKFDKLQAKIFDSERKLIAEEKALAALVEEATSAHVNRIQTIEASIETLNKSIAADRDHLKKVNRLNEIDQINQELGRKLQVLATDQSKLDYIKSNGPLLNTDDINRQRGVIDISNKNLEADHSNFKVVEENTKKLRISIVEDITRAEIELAEIRRVDPILNTDNIRNERSIIAIFEQDAAEGEANLQRLNSIAEQAKKNFFNDPQNLKEAKRYIDARGFMGEEDKIFLKEAPKTLQPNKAKFLSGAAKALSVVSLYEFLTLAFNTGSLIDQNNNSPLGLNGKKIPTLGMMIVDRNPTLADIWDSITPPKYVSDEERELIKGVPDLKGDAKVGSGVSTAKP